MKVLIKNTAEKVTVNSLKDGTVFMVSNTEILMKVKLSNGYPTVVCLTTGMVLPYERYPSKYQDLSVTVPNAELVIK